jgi:anaerobic carbon-monoxide dehydrogenase iron sulfur subunit
VGKRIAFHESLCTNCRLCSMFCSLAFTRNRVYEFRPSIARIRVTENADDTRYVAHVCLQCEIPACADACPVDAIAKSPLTGCVEIDESACIGCGACTEACEFGCVFLVGDKAVKCEVCDEPLCVRACAAKALELVDWDEASMAEQGALYREAPL